MSEVVNIQVYNMAELKLIAVRNTSSSSIRTGSNVITWADKDISHDNQLTSIVNDVSKGYNLTLNDVTTDTFPPYKPNQGREFKALKIAEINNMNVRSSDYASHPNFNLIVGDVIKRENLENNQIGFSYGGGAGQYETRLGYVDLLWSDDGVLFTEDTRQRFYYMYAEATDYGPIGHIVLNFNILAQLDIFNLERTQYINHQDLANALNYSVNNSTLTTNSQEVIDFFETFLSGEYPAKIHIQSITGTNCIRYFENLIQPDQKLSFEAFRQNKITIDYGLMNIDDLPVLEIYIGEARSGIFRKQPLI
ncbi:hypothetical protein HMPREF9716_03684 [Myroides odoratus CIP 103059]|uniref:Uncharacterized protein n=2 Tax=Myroides odoratus TaxID=256 RepID=A0A9Q6Z4T2_MYROD|nr:hypothetical protein Myrod_0716 [Myroides odoratus DSM 2801]EKB02751.1 hypothetical protein HMPREF9716_03684 [Myroides odoratus CIP 103059]QQU02034.1 hypothetical protein I6I88_12190 [Myroides odoratus]